MLKPIVKATLANRNQLRVLAWAATDSECRGFSYSSQRQEPAGRASPTVWFKCVLYRNGVSVAVGLGTTREQASTDALRHVETPRKVAASRGT